MLTLGNIKVMVNGFVILRGVNLELAAGELVALVGRNGAGKTTTLKSIMGLVPVEGGGLNFDGEDLLAVPPHRRAALGIGYMPEDRRLIGSLSVQDNILMPAWANKLEATDERLAYIYHRACAVRKTPRLDVERRTTKDGGPGPCAHDRDQAPAVGRTF